MPRVHSVLITQWLQRESAHQGRDAFSRFEALGAA
jgi:hypothetical protein